MTSHKRRNIVELLERRQVMGGLGPSLRCLNNRVIPLHSIVDVNRQLLNCHVILGFSRCGRYLLSYQDAVSEDDHEYTLHWWLFDLCRPLRHVSEYTLFSESLNDSREVDLIIAQSSDLRHTVAHGCMRAALLSNEGRRMCHVTILPGPGHTEHVIQLKYELLPPFPPFMPYLALRIPGCLLLNTVDRLIAVFYSSTPVNTKAVVHQHFTAERDQCSQCEDWLSVKASSQSALLPVEVLLDGSELAPSPTGDVCVGQSVLDVELWANQMLRSQLENKGLTYHCLLDYDLQIVDVCPEASLAVFLMAAMLQVSNSSGSNDVSMEVVGVWDVCEGVASVRSVTPPTIVPGYTHPPVSVRGQAATLRKQSYLPPGPEVEVRAFSNSTVHSGRSLTSLAHPRLPLNLALARKTALLS